MPKLRKFTEEESLIKISEFSRITGIHPITIYKKFEDPQSILHRYLVEKQVGSVSRKYIKREIFSELLKLDREKRKEERLLNKATAQNKDPQAALCDSIKTLSQQIAALTELQAEQVQKLQHSANKPAKGSKTKTSKPAQPKQKPSTEAEKAPTEDATKGAETAATAQ